MTVAAISVHCVQLCVAANPQPINEFEGSENAAEFGYCVAAGFDFDDDGYADLIVGEPRANYSQTTPNAGQARVYFGPLSSPIKTPITLRMTGAFSYEQLGRSAAFLRDFDGDGVADVAVGGPGGSTQRGRAALFLGVADAGTPSGYSARNFVIRNQVVGEQFGWSLSSAGYFNEYNDSALPETEQQGFTDIVIAAPGSSSATFTGRVGVYFGEANPTGEATVEDVLYLGEDGYTNDASGDAFGWCVSGGSDLNDDGFADIVIGAPYNDEHGFQSGRAYVFSGDAYSVETPVTITAGASTAYTRLSGQSAGDLFGYSVAVLGDVNGDGYRDVAVGAPGFDNAGAIYIYLGGETSLQGTPTPSVRIQGVSGQDGFSVGHMISDAGDVNSDGFADLIVGGSMFSNDVDGTSAVIYGGDQFDPDSQSGMQSYNVDALLVDKFIGNPGSLEKLGFAACRVGNANGDDLEDFAICAFKFPDGTEIVGKVYLWDSGLQAKDVSSTANIDFDGATPYASLVVNYDKSDVNDQGPDLLLTFGDSRQGQIYRNTAVAQGGTLLPDDVSSDVFLTAGFPTIGSSGACVADYDNDGREDIFVSDLDAPRLYHGVVTVSGEEKFELASSSIFDPALATESVAGAWGDYDRDGWVDLYVVRSVGTAGHMDRLLRSGLGRSEGFTDVTAASGLKSTNTLTSAAAWVDLDGDNNLDLYVASSSTGGEYGTFYRNLGSSFQDRTGLATPPRIGSLRYATGVGFADLDNDLDFDLVMSRNEPAGSLNLIAYANTESGNIENEQLGKLAEAKQLNSLAVIDHDLNGYLDLLGAPAQTGGGLLYAGYKIPGDYSLVERGTRVGLVDATALSALGYDHDGDGDPEYFMGRLDGGTPAAILFEARRNADDSVLTSNWVGINLQSAAADGHASGSNRMAIGAEVTVRMPANSSPVVISRRQIGAAMGRGSQDPHTAIFGFGQHVGDFKVTVKWTDNFVQNETFTASELNQILTITEETHPPAFISGTLNFYVVPKPNELVDLYIEWQTAHNSDPALMQVRVKKGLANGPLCYEPPVDPGQDYLTLTASYPGVTTSVTPLLDGTYLNRLVWADRPCRAGCSYTAIDPYDCIGIQGETQGGLSKKCTISACLQ